MNRRLQIAVLFLVCTAIFAGCSSSQNIGALLEEPVPDTVPEATEPEAVFTEKEFITLLNERLKADGVPLEAYCFQPSYSQSNYTFRNTDTGKEPENPLDCRIIVNCNLRNSSVRMVMLDFRANEPDFHSWFFQVYSAVGMIFDEGMTEEEALSIPSMEPYQADDQLTNILYAPRWISHALQIWSSGDFSYTAADLHPTSDELFDIPHAASTVRFKEFTYTATECGEIISEYMNSISAPFQLFLQQEQFDARLDRFTQQYYLANFSFGDLDTDRFGAQISYGKSRAELEAAEYPVDHEKVYQVKVYYDGSPEVLEQYGVFSNLNGEPLEVDGFSALAIAASLAVDDQLSLEEALSIHSMAPTYTEGTKQTTLFCPHEVVHKLEKDTQTGEVIYTAMTQFHYEKQFGTLTE